MSKPLMFTRGWQIPVPEIVLLVAAYAVSRTGGEFFGVPASFVASVAAISLIGVVFLGFVAIDAFRVDVLFIVVGFLGFLLVYVISGDGPNLVLGWVFAGFLALGLSGVSHFVRRWLAHHFQHKSRTRTPRQL